MANISDNPTTGQGAGPGVEGNPILNNSTSPAANPVIGIVWWVIGFLFLLAIIWVIVRVASGAWHIAGK